MVKVPDWARVPVLSRKLRKAPVPEEFMSTNLQ